MRHNPKSQPRIVGLKRIPKVGSLLPAVQLGLEAIAKAERRSVSWVIAEIVSDYFGLDCITNKKKSKEIHRAEPLKLGTKMRVIKFRRRA
jgi:hypothetical protein